ncbi:MAG: RluA family pseudouridine synthase [Schwartzia sp. (in: firmicutes)]
MKLHYIVPEALTPLPVRAFLKRQGVSLRLWRSLKHNGTVTVNGEAVIAALTTLQPGDALTCELEETSPIEPIPMPLDIRYEDDALLIVNKPIAQLVHPVSRHRPEATLANAVTHYYQATGQNLIFHPLHRLDRNTSGLLLIAKQPHIQSSLTSTSSPRFHRQYLGIAMGQLRPTEGAIDLPLGRKPGSLIEQQPTPAGKSAKTCYRVLTETEDASLLALSPITGRTHQIRVHLTALGHPLIGDDLYGTPSPLIPRQALHAFRLDLIHPVTRQPLSVSAPPPDDFLRLSVLFAHTAWNKAFQELF